jgi:ATPase subunit of ABC transporter with duplicated ATPase domains
VPISASLTLRGITKSFGAHNVLTDVSFTVSPQSRIGVLGRNGAGKSTLMRIVAGLETPDSGTITLNPPSAAVGLLPQEQERQAETVTAFLARRTGVNGAEAELEAAGIALGTDEDGAAERFERALAWFNESGAADFERRRDTVLQDVGLPLSFLQNDMRTLSGGQAARASLASIMLSRFDILLLDEPTNDLDFAGLEMLESFLLQQNQGVLLVSHDRAFLERITNAVIEIDEHDHTAAEYQGGWTAYMQEKETRRRHATEDYENFTRQKSDLTARAREQRQWAVQGVAKAKRNPKDNDKMQQGFFNMRTEKQAQKVRSTEKALERLDAVEKPWEGWNLQMELPVAERAGDVVMRLDNAVVERGSFTLGPVSLLIGWAERIAITGPNGAGKSTLLRALLGQLALTSGTQTLGPGVVVGEVDQARALFEGDTPLLDVFVNESQMLLADARSLLAKFDLTASHVLRSSRELSAGERTRASLALLMSRGTNCLVLDEPTNHLDIEAIEQLESALDTYTGTLLVVTHDRRLLDSLRIERPISVEDGKVRE